MVFEFNEFDRGVLENLFDGSIAGVKRSVAVARDEMFHDVLNDKDGVDFALGLEIGILHASFISGFKKRNGRSLNSEEVIELMRITKSKLGLLREAIFQCG